MSDAMVFPETWGEFEESYGFTDREKVYTNGSRLIPSFRVKQWLDYCKDRKTSSNWHTGTPTEEGEYVVETWTGMHSVFTFKNGWWWLSDEIPIPRDANDYIKAYGQKIEPYKEKEDG